MPWFRMPSFETSRSSEKPLSKKVSEDYRQRHTQVPWKIMAGLRDKLIHDYFGINLHIIWDTVEKDIPTLKEMIFSLIK